MRDRLQFASAAGPGPCAGRGARYRSWSRRDLLSVLVRPDKEIAAEVYGVLTGVLFAKPQGVKVTVSDGMVTLSGTLPRADLIPIAERLASGVDGVVTVTCKLTGPSRTPGI